MTKMGNYEIPFDADGNQLSYANGWQNPQMRPNEAFQDTLTFLDYGRARSSVIFTFQRSNGKMVNVFVSDFTAMISHMQRGEITGKFAFRKSGRNYGCYLIEGDKVQTDFERLRKIEKLARRTFEVKGRFHTQHATCDLGDLLG